MGVLTGLDVNWRYGVASPCEDETQKKEENGDQKRNISERNPGQ